MKLPDILAAEGDGPALVTVPNVPIVSTGTYSLAGNPYPGGQTTFTEEDLAAAVGAVDDPAVLQPRLKLGHFSDWGDAEPAFGKASNLRLGDNGQTIYGDYVGVPAWLAEIMPTAYPNRSIEANFNVTTATGKSHRMVITGLALLGVVMPGVATLKDLAGLYSETIPEGVEVKAEESIVATIGGQMKFGRKSKEAKAAVNIEDVRRAFYDNLDASQYAWWITACYIGDGDNYLIVKDDDSGDLYQVPVDVSGSDPEFGDPTPVNVEYVAASGGQRIAAAEAAEVYASRSESRPESTEQEDSDVETLAKRLGLSEDASDDDVRAALEGNGGESGQDPTAVPPSTQEPGQSAGNPADQGPESGTPSPEGEQQPIPTETNPDASASTMTIDKGTLEDLQRKASAGQAVADRVAREDREKVVDNAIAAGKFPPARRQHWLGLMEKDPDGTKETIASLAPGLVPVEEKGGAPAEGDTAVAAYPQEWLSPAERARAGGQPTTNSGPITQEA